MFSARTLVKICGTTTPQDAVLAAEAGADAIGLIFAPISKRLISADVARQASLAVGPAVGRVGVFMDQPVEDVLRLADAARVSAVQLHGFYTDLDLTRIVEYYPVLRALRPQEVEGWRAQARPDLTLLLERAAAGQRAAAGLGRPRTSPGPDFRGGGVAGGRSGAAQRGRGDAGTEASRGGRGERPRGPARPQRPGVGAGVCGGGSASRR